MEPFTEILPSSVDGMVATSARADELLLKLLVTLVVDAVAVAGIPAMRAAAVVVPP
jgi:hypothetical protein